MNFWHKYNRIILIIAFLGLCFLLGFLLYLMFFKNLGPVSEEPGQTGTSTAESGFPSSGTSAPATAGQEQTGGSLEEKPNFPVADNIALGGLTKTDTLLKEDISGLNLTQNGNSLKYYNNRDGKFYQIDKNGELALLSEQVFFEVRDIAWSKTANRAILEYPDGANILYDFDAKKQITLPKHWEDFSFSPNSDKIVSKSLGIDENNRWLVVSNDDGSKVKPIESLGLNDQSVITDWSPNNEVIAIWTEGNNFTEQELYFLGQNGENFKSATLPGRGFEGIWSPQGDKMVYSVYSADSGYKPELWSVDAVGDSIGANRKKLNLNTWAKKCVFSNTENLICAVPRSLEPGSGIIKELASQTTDDLYQINTRTGLKKLLAIPDGNFTINNLNVTANGYTLFFTDSKTGYLHKINLK